MYQNKNKKKKKEYFIEINLNGKKNILWNLQRIKIIIK